MNINNNKFELKPTNSKRKVAAPCPNVYLNPALDFLANEDPMCNTKMEVIPVKKRKRTRSCEIAAFENSGLDLGISKAAVNEFLIRELDNVRKNVRMYDNDAKIDQKFYKADDNVNSRIESVITEASTNFDDALHSIKMDTSNSNFTNNISKVNSNKIAANCNVKVKCVIPPVLLPRSDIPKNSSLPNITFNDTNNDTEPFYANIREVPANNSVDNKNIAIENKVSRIFNNTETVLNSNINTGNIIETEPIYSNITEESNSFRSQMKTITNCESVNAFLPNTSEIDSGISGNDLNISAITNLQTTVTNQFFVNNSNLSLSFIDRLALDSPNTSNHSLYLDDDLNESNIMEIKTITIITKKKRIEKKNTNPFLPANAIEHITNNIDNVPINTDNTNPFVDFTTDEIYSEGILNRPVAVPIPKNIIPRQLFTETNSTISTVNESIFENHYENISSRSESPIYENLDDPEPFNKQSKILGHDVSKFSAYDILNLNKINQTNSSHDSTDSKNDLKHKLVKASNKLSKKVFKTLKKTFKGEKEKVGDTTLNPYEVPRKPAKQKVSVKESGIENPGLNLDNSDEIEIEEIEGEPEYETIKTIRNTRLNMNVTPLKERVVDNIDISNSRVTTPGKKVRFDSTLNQEKVITGDSFDYELQSPGFDSKIDKYHDELENCINERKFLQQI
ncbi:hypothetical protein K1T71_011468 [Dendrolimus kikuchii]|uniref:Uncharacterized protein n=1 Tax=Dendrolimus kikuchii TaxID=765133 RepID=A0ACC1CP98_9NEOP|nr:hypothetical protein K1T71_011468 [Dendrolimus kikuchii]